MGRTAEAERDYERAVAGDRTLGSKRRLAATLEAIAGFYESVPGKERRAIAALQEAGKLNDAVYNEETSRRTQELQERFDAERRQRQIDQLQHDKTLAQLEASRQRLFQIGLATLAAVLIGGLAFAIWRYRVQARTAQELREALQKVQTLQRLLPICSHCKKIRDDSGYWQQVESYISQHSGTRFSHGICPDCMDTHYADVIPQKD